MANQIDVDVSRRIKASAETVWAVLADLNRLPDWQQFAAAVEDVSGPAQPGATYTVKPHKSYEPTTHWTVTEAEPPSRQLHTSEMPVVSPSARCSRSPTRTAAPTCACTGPARRRASWTADAIDDAEAHHAELGALARGARPSGERLTHGRERVGVRPVAPSSPRSSASIRPRRRRARARSRRARSSPGCAPASPTSGRRCRRAGCASAARPAPASGRAARRSP